jgi:hypothetical protein
MKGIDGPIWSMARSQLFLKSGRAGRFCVAAFLMGVYFIPQPCRGVQLSMRDTTFSAAETLYVALTADFIPADPGLFAYQFTLTFNPQVLTGIGASANGTLTQPFGDPFTSGNTIPGELRVAAAGTHAVSGSGALVTLLLGAASPQSGQTAVQLTSVLLNEGSPPAYYAVPLATISVAGIGAALSPHPRAAANVIQVYPNPAREQLQLSLPSTQVSNTVRIWNLLGRQVMDIRSGGRTLSISLKALPNGTYFVTVDHQQGWFARFQISK